MGDSVSADALHLLRLILDTPLMRELSVAEQRYQTVLAVISDGLSVTQAAEKAGVSRQTVHGWLARYEAEGLDGLVDRSHRPVSCPHQMPAQVEAAVLRQTYSRRVLNVRRLNAVPPQTGCTLQINTGLGSQMACAGSECCRACPVLLCCGRMRRLTQSRPHSLHPSTGW